MHCFQTLYIVFVYSFHYVLSTEVTVSTYTIDQSLDIQIELPVLMCHVRHTGYKVVSWYKDFTLLKRGTADFADHILPLSTLLNTNSSSVVFEHPLKLQGYYWCETDHTQPATIFDYLFRIKEVHTYVGRFIATSDSLGDDEELTMKEKLSWKMNIYEQEMENALFQFLPCPSVFVTDMKIRKKGLEVRFFLYVRQELHPRRPIDHPLVLDQQHLDYILEYLSNKTSAVDAGLYSDILTWTEFRGIEIDAIDLKSTLGCYEETSLTLSKPSEELTWPYARIGAIVIPDNACSSNNGLTVTRVCTGSFYTGARWGNPSGECDKPAEGITLQLKLLYDDFGNEHRPHYIEKLNTLTRYPSELGVTGLHFIAEILKQLSRLSNLDQKDISGLVSVIDKLMDTNRTVLEEAKSTIRLTSRILKVFDDILDLASQEEKEIQISKQHLLIDTKYTKPPNGSDHLVGFVVTSPHQDLSLENGSIESVLSSSKLPRENSIAYFALPQELVLQRESDFEFCQVNLVFFKEWYLFQSPKDVLVKRNYKVAATPVMYVSISGGPEWNLSSPVLLYFKDTSGEEIENPVCVYYDTRINDGVGAWSSEGCEYGGLKNGFHNCLCHHLSIFAIILSHRPDTPSKYKLGVSVYVGCGVSMLALSLACILFILSKNWRLTVDHSILFCLALTLLINLILIFISEMHFLWTPGCMVLALIFHYTVFAIFGWLLVQAVVYQLRFAKKTDVTEIPNFMVKSALSVWGAPIVIVILIWFSKDYSSPSKDNCWLTVSEVAKVSVIPIVTLMLITLCVNVCAAYALTCRFRKDFLIGDTNYSDPALKFRVGFTIFLFFVLSWLFGFFALHKRSKELRILFSISITLTAYYVTLFFIFQEISFWELCSKWKRKEKEPSVPAVQYQSKSYKSIEIAKETEK